MIKSEQNQEIRKSDLNHFLNDKRHSKCKTGQKTELPWSQLTPTRCCQNTKLSNLLSHFYNIITYFPLGPFALKKYNIISSISSIFIIFHYSEPTVVHFLISPYFNEYLPQCTTICYSSPLTLSQVYFIAFSKINPGKKKVIDRILPLNSLSKSLKTFCLCAQNPPKTT